MLSICKWTIREKFSPDVECKNLQELCFENDHSKNMDIYFIENFYVRKIAKLG